MILDFKKEVKEAIKRLASIRQHGTLVIGRKTKSGVFVKIKVNL